MKTLLITTQNIFQQDDILLARQKARQIAALLMFDTHQQTKIAAAVSEIARELRTFTRGGTLEYHLQSSERPMFLIHVTPQDQAKFTSLLNESKSSFRSASGLVNARRLLDYFSVSKNASESRTAIFGKCLNSDASVELLMETIQENLGTLPQNAELEIEALNQELLRTIEALQKRQEEVTQLNTELEETNRGVVVLYTELDDKAESLRKADQLKTRFLSHMSHEFRTPLNSILGLGRLLLDRMDGTLTPEQEKQITFIISSAQGLNELVNDLLDIAKIEAGKIELHLSRFSVFEMFGTLRGMFRPLQTNPFVVLNFLDVSSFPEIYNDEAKISQILRNYISNALKFTEKGEVRVSAELDPSGGNLIFAVTDTGIGIPAEEQPYLFQEFSQLETPLQKKTKGTGLGLALCRKLSELLGGTVYLTSEPGNGSTFFLKLPALLSGTKAEAAADSRVHSSSVLIVDDDEVWRYLVKGWLDQAGYQVLEATNGKEGLKLAEAKKPDLILLDLNMPELNGFEFLKKLRSNPQTEFIPVIVSTSKILEPEELSFLEKHSTVVLGKDGLTRQEALRSFAKVNIK